jgi:hypothetical protein
MHITFYRGNLKESRYLGDLGVDRRILLKLTLKAIGYECRCCLEYGNVKLI